MRKNMRANHPDALGDAVWNISLALSVALLSAGVALSVARVAAPSRAVRPSVALNLSPSLPVTLDSCPPLELPQGWGVKPGSRWQPAYFESQVERPAQLLRGEPWNGLDTTRLVVTLFAIDTAGRPIEGTLEVSKVYWPRRQRLWELPSVVRVLRYRPAEQPRGRKVCQVVE